MKNILIAFALSFTASAFASDKHEHKPEIPKDLETLKKLVGTWEGTTKMGDKEEKTTVVYAVTSGGTAVTETLMPGTPHEMISVYHKDGKSVAMTHYCAFGNQPHMKLKNKTGNAISFEVKKPVGISSLKEQHMHSLTLTMADDNTLTQEWQNWKDGKPGEKAVFNFKRKR